MGRRAAAPALAAVALALLGCTGGGDDDAGAPGTDGPPAAGAVAPPPSASPFCEGMLAIADRLSGDDRPADVTAYLVDAYREVLPDAPAELAADLEALITSLERGDDAASASPTTWPVATSVPADDVVPTVIVVLPAERVAEYVSEHCARVEANPGPPPTQPSGGLGTLPPD